MTEQEIEKAARKLCELRGIDPERSVPHGAEPNEHGFIPAIMLWSPAWRIVAKEVVAMWQMVQAVDYATAGREFP